MHWKKYHLHNCNSDSQLHNFSIKIDTYITEKTIICKNTAEISNSIIVTETVNCSQLQQKDPPI